MESADYSKILDINFGQSIFGKNNFYFMIKATTKDNLQINNIQLTDGIAYLNKENKISKEEFDPDFKKLKKYSSENNVQKVNPESLKIDSKNSIVKEDDKKNSKQSTSIIFKSNDNLLLNEISDRTFDKNIFEIKLMNKSEKSTNHNKNNIGNYNSEILYSLSAKHITDNLIKINTNSTFNKEEFNQKNIYETINKFDNSISNKSLNKKLFTSCISKEETLLCKIKKSKVKMKYGRKLTIFQLYIDFTNKFLMSCKKISNFTNTEYIFSLDEDPIESSKENIIGKLVSRLFGNVYDIYDMTDNKIHDKESKLTPNILVGTIEYVIFQF